MLGMYTMSNEPTDETKAAAEKLLNYLREQRTNDNKVSDYFEFLPTHQ